MRVEQLYPFPKKSLHEQLGRFPNAEVIWCQEESENMGAWTFIDRRLEGVMVDLNMTPNRPRYVGRSDSAAPATGLLKRHLQEQAKLVDEALTLPPKAKARRTPAKKAPARKPATRRKTK